MLDLSLVSKGWKKEIDRLQTSAESRESAGGGLSTLPTTTACVSGHCPYRRVFKLPHQRFHVEPNLGETHQAITQTTGKAADHSHVRIVRWPSRCGIMSEDSRGRARKHSCNRIGNFWSGLIKEEPIMRWRSIDVSGRINTLQGCLLKPQCLNDITVSPF